MRSVNKDGESWRETVLDVSVLQLSTLVLVRAISPGIPKVPLWEGSPFMHVSLVKMIADNLPHIIRWNPYWYFGTPFLRFYPPLSYHLWGLLAWSLGISVFEAFPSYSFLIFSLGATSTYLLGFELGLGRTGRLASGLLYLTAFNLYSFWDAGSIPNITAVDFSVVALVFLLRAARKLQPADILALGISSSLVLLTHLNNALILAVLFVSIGVILLIFRPDLIVIRRGLTEPPLYTLRLPKVFLLASLTALAIGSYWWLPFLTSGGPSHLGEYVTVGLIPSDERPPLIPRLLEVLGINVDATNLLSPGLGHILLALGGCTLAFKARRENSIIMCASFVFCFAACFAPSLGVTLGVGNRFSPYLAIFSALLGGYFIEKINVEYRRLVPSNRVVLSFISALILLTAAYPAVAQVGTYFTRTDFAGSKPALLMQLSDRIVFGERVATDSTFWQWQLNAYGDPIWQWGSSDLAAMTNDFAYIFWYYLMYQKDARFLPYFARSYNVKWFISDGVPSGLKQVVPELYEVEGFDSSFVETISPNSTIVLFVGDSDEYSSFFVSSALVNPQDVIPVYGGSDIGKYALEELRDFDVIYLHGLRYGTPERLNAVSSLLSSYVDSGGGLILGTGDLAYGNEMDNIPSPFPVTKTSVYAESCLLLTAKPHIMTDNVRFVSFATNESQSVSYAASLKAGAEPLVYDEDRPVLPYWKYGSGEVVWTGLRLPYQTALSKNAEEARFLINIIRFASRVESGRTKGSVAWESPNFETILAHVTNAYGNEAIWMKMSYYTGWTAQVIGADSTPLRIYQAGPNMMIVFPKRSGDYEIKFDFVKTVDVLIGETISMAAAVALLGFMIFTGTRKVWSKHNTPGRA